MNRSSRRSQTATHPVPRMRGDEPDLTVARIVVVESYTEYTALPAAQRRSNDIVIVRGV